MLHRVEPLRNELKKLERDAAENMRRGEEVNSVIQQLEKSIAAYKEEYALLISEAQSIKADLSAVESKVSLDNICMYIYYNNIITRHKIFDC